MITINACAYCGRKAQGHYAIERDGTLNNDDAPAVPLCDDCGSSESPSLRQIWARISLRDDTGREWGPTIHRCRENQSPG